MSASVYIDFVAPNDLPDITKLHIYEATTPDGPWSEIEVVTPVGTQGDYITYYTTSLATSADNFFSIRWENVKGAISELSDPVQGNTRSVIADVTQRMLLRNPSLDEEIAYQEAAAVVEQYTGSLNPDPATISQQKLTGMTLLALARTQLSVYAAGSTTGDSWVAGLVSMKSSTGTSFNTDTFSALLKQAQSLLGISTSRVAQMCVPEIAGGLAQIVTADISRLMIEVE